MPILSSIDLYPQLKQLEPYFMSTKSVDFRPLPTPEQIRAHGEGGLWETENGRYKLWDRDRTTPWYDCRPFCPDGQPWKPSAKCIPCATSFRPLNPDGTPRDWAEIDAIVAQGTPSAAAAATEPDYRAPTDAELRAHVANGGYWQRGSDGWFYEIWTDSNNRLLGWCHTTLPNTRGEGWDATNHTYFGVHRKHLRPVDRQGKPMPWPAITVPTTQSSAPVVTPPPDGKFQVGDVVRVLRFSDDERFEGGNPHWCPAMADCLDAPTTVVDCFGTWLSVKDSKSRRWSWPVERVSFVSRPSKAGPEQKPAAVTAPVATASLPKDGDPITVASAVAIAREGARQALQEVGQASLRSIDTLAASELDSLSRQPNETDEQLRQRCRDAKAKENPMPSTNHVTSLGTPIPDFAKMSPEDRARYRAALDAVDASAACVVATEL